MRHFKEVVQDEEIYGLPATNVSEANTLMDMLLGNDGNGLPGAEGDFVEDVMGAPEHDLEELSSVPLQVFKVLKASPKISKKIKTVRQELRTDHIAVQFFVAHRMNPAEPSHLSISSPFSESRGQVRLLSLTEFLSVGKLMLKRRFVKCKVSPESQYSISCLPEQLRRDPFVLQATTALVNAGAYAPGPCLVYQLPAHTCQDARAAIACMVECGAVRQFGPEAFQLSEEALGSLHRVGLTVGFTPALQPREALQLKDRTHWELIFELEDAGWTMSPFAGRSIPPLRLNNVKDSDKVFYINKTGLDVGKPYLEVLCSLPSLQRNGIKEVLHRQASRYYLRLLDREPPPVANRALVDDNSLLDALADRPAKRIRTMRPSIMSGVREGLLALEDDEVELEGEPEELLDASVSLEALKTTVDSTKSHWYGRFKFTHVKRAILKGSRRGTFNLQWQVTCPFHRDPADPPDTHCTKTVSYEGEAAGESVAKQLRWWAVHGRTCKTRARPGSSHKSLRMPKPGTIDDDDLLEKLDEGLAAGSWVLTSLFDGSSSSSSDSSLASSSNS